MESLSIVVLKTKNQQATLTAEYNPNIRIDESTFKYELTGTPSDSWAFNYGEVATSFAYKNVKVTNISKHKSLGCFSIGNKKNWLYSHNLWNTPENLESAIYELLCFSLTGEKSQEINLETN